MDIAERAQPATRQPRRSGARPQGRWSGEDVSRAGLLRCAADPADRLSGVPGEGDTPAVTKPDRLARSTRELLENGNARGLPGQGRGQVQGAQAEARVDAGEDQGAVGFWRDACADREEPKGGPVVCVSRGSWASCCSRDGNMIPLDVDFEKPVQRSAVWGANLRPVYNTFRTT